MNILEIRLPKDVLNIIYDFSKDKTNYDKVMNHYTKTLLNVIPKTSNMFFSSRIPDDEKINYICLHKKSYGTLIRMIKMQNRYCI